VAVVVAVAVIEPVACGSTVIVTVAEALLARAPIVQVTVGAVIEQLPCDEVAETIVRAAPERRSVDSSSREDKGRTPQSGPLGPIPGLLLDRTSGNPRRDR
jgi:hypothetical protein